MRKQSTLIETHGILKKGKIRHHWFLSRDGSPVARSMDGYDTPVLAIDAALRTIAGIIPCYRDVKLQHRGFKNSLGSDFMDIGDAENLSLPGEGNS